MRDEFWVPYSESNSSFVPVGYEVLWRRDTDGTLRSQGVYRPISSFRMTYTNSPKWKFINFIETTKHKLLVAWYILMACGALLKRAIVHDMSKYSRFEARRFEAALPNLQNLEYGSSEYKEAIKSLGPALEHHYENNSHHPEYWEGFIDYMSPLDQIEMLCDWKAAGKRHKTGDMGASLKINQVRFPASVQFHDALRRDSEEIGLLK